MRALPACFVLVVLCSANRAEPGNRRYCDEAPEMQQS
jgi:hypothetical protein